MLQYIHWNPNPILIDLGFLQPKWYGVLFVSGIALGYVFFKKEAPKQSIPLQKIDYLLFLVMGLSILGARLVHVFFYDWPAYKDSPGDILKIWEGGLASHGGGMGMLLATWIWVTFIAKVNFWKILDLMAIPTPLAGAFIRFGNLWNSEILGKPTDVPWAFVFESKDMIPRHPVQVYEALCYIIGSLILFGVYKKYGLNKKGLLTACFLLVVFVPRFLLEFLKEPQESYDLGIMLNTGQLLSIPMIIIGTAATIYILRKK